MIDIAKETLYIRSLRRVIASSLPYRKKPNARKDRPSDCFVFVLEGGCTYRFREGTVFTVVPGDILYLAATSCYTMELQSGTYGYIFCDFDFDGAEERRSAKVASPHPARTEADFRRLRREYKRGDKSFTECLSLLYRIYGDFRVGAEAPYVNRDVRARLEESRCRVEEAFADPALSVKALAADAGMSEVYFRKLFRALYGDSPSAYLSFVRLRAAEEWMRYTEMSLREIALKSGFSSAPYFCRAFKKKRGVTPARWRRLNRVPAP